jgi:hypothetical protein
MGMLRERERTRDSKLLGCSITVAQIKTKYSLVVSGRVGDVVEIAECVGAI